MAEIIDTYEPVRSALTGAVGVTDITSTRIYGDVAPSGTTYPNVIYYKVTGGPDNDTPSDRLDDVFRIESRATNPVTCSTLHRAVYTAFHEQTLTMTGWTNFWTVCNNEQTFTEHLDGTGLVWRKVWDVQIRASKD